MKGRIAFRELLLIILKLLFPVPFDGLFNGLLTEIGIALLSDLLGRGTAGTDALADRVREQRNAYFREKAIEKAIERDREKQLKNNQE